MPAALARPQPHEQTSYATGIQAEAVAVAALTANGWHCLLRRARTRSGEIDIVAQNGQTISFIEVKSRVLLENAAYAVTRAQQKRIMSAAEILLGSHPEWSYENIRFDVILVDRLGRTRRITDAFRLE